MTISNFLEFYDNKGHEIQTENQILKISQKSIIFAEIIMMHTTDFMDQDILALKTYSLLSYISLKYSILLSLFNSVKKDVIHFINFAVIIKNVRGGVKKRLSHIYQIVSYDRMKHLKLLCILCKDFLSLIGISQGFREKTVTILYSSVPLLPNHLH